MLNWFRRGPAPASRAHVELDRAALDKAFEPYDDFFVRPDFEALTALTEALPEELRDPAWWQIAERWLEALRVDLAEFEVERGPLHLMLSPFPAKKRKNLSEFCGKVLKTLRAELPELVPMHGPHVILLFEDTQDYYEYVGFFHGASARPIGLSSGNCIRQGYGHVAAWGEKTWQLEAVLAHELTHDCLVSFTLPSWVEEGLCQLNEGRFALQDHGLVTPEEFRLQRRWWGPRGLASFWTGRSFSLADDGQELSYKLALYLVRRLLEDHAGPRFEAFLRAASCQDAGRAAAQEHLGISLNRTVAEFLGPGEWI